MSRKRKILKSFLAKIKIWAKLSLHPQEGEIVKFLGGKVKVEMGIRKIMMSIIYNS